MAGRCSSPANPEDDGLWLFPNKGVSEVVNDINGSLINFWRVLQDPKTFESFRRRLEATPMARQEWEEAHSHVYGSDPIADAVAFFVDCRQSRSGMMNTFTSVTRNRTASADERQHIRVAVGDRGPARRSSPAQPRLDREDERTRLDRAGRYTRGPLLLRPALPPRNEDRTDAYPHEMSEAEHRELLAALLECKGKVMLSGYPSTLYDSTLKNWTRHTFELPNNAAGGETKRRMTEVLWCNF